jgi:outer membrane lipoprotein-sorting protein
MRKWIFLFVLSVACTSIADPTTQPTLSNNSTTDQILDALDARGTDLKDFSANVTLTDTATDTGDTHISIGSVILQRKSPTDVRIRVAFTKKQVDNLITPQDHEYVLDNGVLDDRDYQLKHENKGQLLKPGQNVDLFKLGEGPFPLPLGQKREDVLKIFDVARVGPTSDDPPGTVHLQLTPKDGTEIAKDFKTIDVWVETQSAMPRRIQTLDINQTTTRTTDLANVKLNTGVTDKDFTLPPTTPEWNVIEGPYGQ